MSALISLSYRVNILVSSQLRSCSTYLAQLCKALQDGQAALNTLSC